MPIAVTEASFQNDVIAGSQHKPVLVYFWASWCAPCRLMGPILERMEAKNAEVWTLAKVGTEAEVQLTAQRDVNSLPALQLFMHGQQVAEFIDLLPETELTQWLNDAIAAAIGS